MSCSRRGFIAQGSDADFILDFSSSFVALRASEECMKSFEGETRQDTQDDGWPSLDNDLNFQQMEFKLFSAGILYFFFTLECQILSEQSRWKSREYS